MASTTVIGAGNMGVGEWNGLHLVTCKCGRFTDVADMLLTFLWQFPAGNVDVTFPAAVCFMRNLLSFCFHFCFFTF